MDRNSEQLKYPIGKFKLKHDQEHDYSGLIDRIASLPDKVRLAIENLDDLQLDTPYRQDGWTLRQVIHHLPDSHMNAYIRFKQAITEDNPTIKPYYEERWAESDEAKHAPVEVSLDLLDSLHRRWVLFLRSLNPHDFTRTYYHPTQDKNYVLSEVLNMYVWHGEHHLAHITETKRLMGW